MKEEWHEKFEFDTETYKQIEKEFIGFPLSVNIYPSFSI